MPRDTFNNLSKSKKKIIFAAAVGEFAARRFTEASINKIVKESGISRGSFYQYFEGKEDLYLYVLGEIGKEKMAFAFAEPLTDAADFIGAYMHMITNILALAREKPLYYKIGMLMEHDDSEFIAKLKPRVPDAWASFRRLIDHFKEQGSIRKDADSDLVMDMLIIQNLHFLQEFYRTGSEENLLRQTEDMLKIIWGGIANV